MSYHTRAGGHTPWTAPSAKCWALEISQTTIAVAVVSMVMIPHSHYRVPPQLLRTGLQPDSLTSQGELPSHLPTGVEDGSNLYLFSIISVLHSPRALHPHPDLLPGVAGPLGMCLGWGHLGLCSSYIIASVNTGNVVLFPRHDCTRLLDGTCSFQEKAQIHSQS